MPELGESLREKIELSLCQARRWGIKNALTYCELGMYKNLRTEREEETEAISDWQVIHFPQCSFYSHRSFTNHDHSQVLLVLPALKENSLANCFPENRGSLAWTPSSSLLSHYKLYLMFATSNLFSQKEDCLYHFSSLSDCDLHLIPFHPKIIPLHQPVSYFPLT